MKTKLSDEEVWLRAFEAVAVATPTQENRGSSGTVCMTEYQVHRCMECADDVVVGFNRRFRDNAEED